MSIRHLLLGLLAALALSHARLPAQDPDGYPRLMQGPLLGAVAPDGILVWARAAGPWTVQIRYADNPRFDNALLTPPQTARREDDYCLTLALSGLRPDTTYFYEVRVGGEPDTYLRDLPPFSFRTAPGPDFRGRFSLAFGSCARWQREPRQTLWRVIEAYRPDFFCWLGDNVYADTLDPQILAEEYRRQREVPDLQSLNRHVPQLAVWDDHDYGLNNHDRTNPRRVENLEVFRRYWPNPSYGLPGTPGVFFHYRYGGVDFFFLDDRYHRDPNATPPGPGKSMLGAGQMAWLREGLRASRAPFKVIVSGSVFADAKGPDGDAWSAFRHERDALFDFLRDERIEGVVLLSGDTHTGELNCIPRSAQGGYDLYDLTSSPLAQEPDNDWLFRPVELRLRVPYDQGANFGLVRFDTTGEEPELRFNLIGLEGKPVWSDLVLRPSELRNGVESWPAKQDRAAARWMSQFREGWRDR